MDNLTTPDLDYFRNQLICPPSPSRRPHWVRHRQQLLRPRQRSPYSLRATEIAKIHTPSRLGWASAPPLDLTLLGRIAFLSLQVQLRKRIAAARQLTGQSEKKMGEPAATGGGGGGSNLLTGGGQERALSQRILLLELSSIERQELRGRGRAEMDGDYWLST
ncbi:hypothetical protein PG993_003610 [Apiospora rasikravindrae]|uniref:Uncharacterized protein n=1 Tax=Apiospora rasikravindrae TaxID=990691 RepID=A0ABR1U014_9PEZI